MFDRADVCQNELIIDSTSLASPTAIGGIALGISVMYTIGMLVKV